MKDENCIFCKIIAQEIPAHIIYEDEHFLGFLDIKPHAKGHTMLVPKNHAEDIFGLNDTDMATILASVRRTMQLLQEKLAPDSFNVGWNNGKHAGQEVNHLHIHIMPRYEGDGGGSLQSIVDAPGDMSAEEVAKLITS